LPEGEIAPNTYALFSVTKQMEGDTRMERHTHRHGIFVQDHVGRVNIRDGVLVLWPRAEERWSRIARIPSIEDFDCRFTRHCFFSRERLLLTTEVYMLALVVSGFFKA
jgi:hypothetical protein